MLEKIKTFYSENKKVVLIGLGLVAVVLIWRKTKK